MVVSGLNSYIKAGLSEIQLSYKSDNCTKDLRSSTLSVWSRQPSTVVVFYYLTERK